MSGVADALAEISAMPDSSMSLISWWRDEHGELVRPCTRQEIADGLRSRAIDPESVLAMARFAALTEDQLADLAAGARRQNMRAV